MLTPWVLGLLCFNLTHTLEASEPPESHGTAKVPAEASTPTASLSGVLPGLPSSTSPSVLCLPLGPGNSGNQESLASQMCSGLCRGSQVGSSGGERATRHQSVNTKKE